MSGTFPIRIAFPCLAGILLGDYNLPDELFINVLVDSLSIHDINICQQAFEQINQGLVSFTDNILSSLMNILGYFGCRALPSPKSFKSLLLQSATFEYKVKPSSAIQAIRSGIPLKN